MSIIPPDLVQDLQQVVKQEFQDEFGAVDKVVSAIRKQLVEELRALGDQQRKRADSIGYDMVVKGCSINEVKVRHNELVMSSNAYKHAADMVENICVYP